MAPGVCLVPSCGLTSVTRGLCGSHRLIYEKGRAVNPHLTLAAWLHEQIDPEPVVCFCEVPLPDAIGQCRECGRKVVTFMLANRDKFREQYPEQWTRAEQLSLFPEVAPNVVLIQK